MNHLVRVVLDNGQLHDTIAFNVYVLDTNEYAELPDADLVWSADTIRVFNNLTIPNARTLTINPGVYVEFQDHYALNVEGRIIAKGDSINKITFTAKDTLLSENSGGWHGLRFNYPAATNDTSFVTDCLFEYGNGYGPDWTDKYGPAVYGNDVEKLVIANSTIQNCRSMYSYGILYFRYSYVHIINNLIANNEGTGIEMISCDSSIIESNTMVNNNYYSIDLNYSSPVITNNILANTTTENYYSYGGTPKLTFNNILNLGLTTNGNIDEDPMFVGSGANPYALQSNSICLNAGNPDWTTDSLRIKTDILGNPRIYTSGSISKIDLGAYELQSDPDPYLYLDEISDKYISFDSLFVLPIAVKSMPDSLSYQFIQKPDSMKIINDTIFWTPLVKDKTQNFPVELVLDNGKLKDTLAFDIYVLDTNEYFELPARDLVWDADTIKVYNNLTISNDCRLTIMPGVFVKFMDHYHLNIKGSVLAKGNPDSLITFSAADTLLAYEKGGWGGLRFNYLPSADSSVIDYCRFEFGNSYGSYPNYYGAAIYIYYADKIKVTNSVFTKNYTNGSHNGVIYIENAAPDFGGNLIADNRGTAITIDYKANPLLINNTITNNDFYGLGFYYDDSEPIIQNCLITGNNYGNRIEQTNAINIAFCNIEGLTSYQNNNMNLEPGFVNQGGFTYALNKTSPCLNAGNPADSVLRSLLSTDILGNSRIYAEGDVTRVDIGAYELQSNPELYITIPEQEKKYLEVNMAYHEKLNFYSYPENPELNLINAPAGMTIANDTLFWTPTSEQLGQLMNAGVEIVNGTQKDTLNLNYFVLGINEFASLPDADLTWDADTIKVYNNLTVMNNRTLIIKPGTYVEFQGHYRLDIKGRLLARGNVVSIITLTAKDTVFTNTSGGWNGIQFNNLLSTNDTSFIEYCNLKYGNGFISSNYSDFSGGAIYVYNFAKIKILNNVIENCFSINGGAILAEYSNLIVNDNIIRNVSSENAGIIHMNSGELIFKRNKVYDNTSVENILTLSLYYATGDIVNNIFFGNEYINNGWDRKGEVYANNSTINLINNTFL